jgi:nucleotide-binding universal stress UspA family protein
MLLVIHHAPKSTQSQFIFTHLIPLIMKTIKNILVPTDFSVTARNAFHYAKVLAEACGAEITVLHVNEYFLPVSEIAVAPLSKQEESRVEEAMQEFIADESSEVDVMVQSKVKTKILRGDPVSRIVDLSQHADVDLIVMGTTGLQDFLSKIVGSTSLDISNKAHCPVVLVPRDAKWKRIDKMLFSTTYEAASPQMVREVSDFARIFKAKVDFVHVDDTPWDEDNDTDRLFDELFAEADPDFSFEIHNIKRADVVEGLRKYAEKNNIDIIAFVSKHRNFWQNLMHSSVSQNVAISTYKPMLVMHYDDKN